MHKYQELQNTIVIKYCNPNISFLWQSLRARDNETARSLSHFCDKHYAGRQDAELSPLSALSLFLSLPFPSPLLSSLLYNPQRHLANILHMGFFSASPRPHEAHLRRFISSLNDADADLGKISKELVTRSSVYAPAAMAVCK